MILIPEQVRELSSAINNQSKDASELKEYEEILRSNDYLKKIRTDRVSLGSKINLYLQELEKYITIILVDNITNADSNKLYVKRNSLIGRSIYGKEKASNFSFCNHNIKINGKILDISSSPNNFIMNRPKSARICKDMEKYLRRLRQEHHLDELKKVNMISKSQFQLLLKERDRLTRLLKREESINFSETDSALLGSIYAIYSRLGLVEKALTEKNIADYSCDKYVGVGSKVSIVTKIGANFASKTFEFINCAVSDELDTEYVEGISPLGNAIYNKRKGDTFTYKNKENITVEGIICDIKKAKTLRK